MGPFCSPRYPAGIRPVREDEGCLISLENSALSGYLGGMKRKTPLFVLVLTGILAPVVSAQTELSVADQDLRFGDRLYQRGDYDLAVRKYEEFLKGYPNDPRIPQVRYRLADSFFQQGRMKEAKDEFDKCLEQTTDPGRSARIRSRLGQIAFETKEFEKAREIFKSLLAGDLEPEVRETSLFFLGRTESELGEHENAVGTLGDLASGFPNGAYTPYGRVIAARSLQKLGKDAEAASMLVECATRALASADDSLRTVASDSLLGGAQILDRLGKPAPAAEAYRIYVESFPDSGSLADALYGEIRNLSQIGQHAKAIGPVERLLGILKENPRPDLKLAGLFLAGTCYYETGQFEKSMEYYMAVLDIGTPWEEAKKLHPQASVRVVRALFELKSYTKAIEVSDAFETRFADNPEVVGELHFVKGQSYIELGRHDKAILEFSLLLPVDEKNSLLPWNHPLVIRATYQIARSSLLIGEYENAADNFIGYVEKYPNEKAVPDALFFAAESLYRMNKYQRAVERFEQLISRYPDSPRWEEAFVRRGECYVHLGKFDQVYEVFSEFEKKRPDSPRIMEALYYEGFVLVARGKDDKKNYEKAIEQFDLLLKRFPDSRFAVDAKVRKGLCLYFLGQPPEAAETILEVLRSDRPARGLDSAVTLWLAGYLQSEKRWEDALMVYDKAQKLFPGTEVAEKCRFETAECYRFMENREKAIAAYEDLLKTFPGTGYIYQANYGLGLAYQKMKKFAEAATAFRIAEKTGNLEVRLDSMYRLGEVLRDAGRSEEALEVFYEIAVTFENDEIGPRAYWEAAQLQGTLGKKDKMKVTLRYLIKTYPNSSEAAKAKATLGDATQE